MEKEFNLSEKLIEIPNNDGIWDGDEAVSEADIKEFIKSLKELILDKEFSESIEYDGEDRAKFLLNKRIDKLAGEKFAE